MKQKLSVHFLVRASSAVVLALLLLCDFLSYGKVSPDRLCLDIWWAVLVLLMYPSSHDSIFASVPFVAAAACLAPALKFLDPSPFVTVLSGTSLVLAHVLRRGVAKFADVEPLFHVTGVWHWVEDYTWLIHVCISLWAGIIAAAFARSPSFSWVWSVSLALLYYVQYRRVYTRSTMLLGEKKENLIRKAQRGSAFKPPIQFVDSDSRSAVLFNEVVRLMENKRPWLQDDFGVDDLARMARTNRLYLSKAINFHAGRNFNQLVNYYRVRYAQELIRKDPTLKMNEVSQMSGFHTVVSFNMAFKLNERMTPTEFAQSLKKIQS